MYKVNQNSLTDHLSLAWCTGPALKEDLGSVYKLISKDCSVMDDYEQAEMLHD